MGRGGGDVHADGAGLGDEQRDALRWGEAGDSGHSYAGGLVGDAVADKVADAYPPLAAAVDTGPSAVGPMSEAKLRLATTGAEI